MSEYKYSIHSVSFTDYTLYDTHINIVKAQYYNSRDYRTINTVEEIIERKKRGSDYLVVVEGLVSPALWRVSMRRM